MVLQGFAGTAKPAEKGHNMQDAMKYVELTNGLATIARYAIFEDLSAYWEHPMPIEPGVTFWFPAGDELSEKLDEFASDDRTFCEKLEAATA